MENDDTQKHTEIGKRIRDAREREGLTQSQLAMKLGYSSPTAISLIEDGKRKVRVADLEKLAEILHREASYFIQGETASKPDVAMALRADPDIDSGDINKIETLIEALKLAKNKEDGRRNSGT